MIRQDRSDRYDRKIDDKRKEQQKRKKRTKRSIRSIIPHYIPHYIPLKHQVGSIPISDQWSHEMDGEKISLINASIFAGRSSQWSLDPDTFRGERGTAVHGGFFEAELQLRTFRAQAKLAVELRKVEVGWEHWEIMGSNLDGIRWSSNGYKNKVI